MSKGEHWYQATSEGIVPCYEVPKAKGEGTRPTTIADARKLGLLPSITTILKVINRPELQSWIVDNAINSALTLPIIDGEPPDAFKERVREDADRQSREAMNWGTRVHDAIEDYLLNGIDGCNPDLDLVPFVEPTILWLEQNLEKIISVESYVGCPKIGVAGRLDLHAVFKDFGEGLCDFKTQRMRKGNAVFYKEWLKQLSAYNHLLPTPQTDTLLSIVIDSSQPGLPQIKKWDNIEQAWKLFLYAFELWKDQKDYNPSHDPSILSRLEEHVTTV